MCGGRGGRVGEIASVAGSRDTSHLTAFLAEALAEQCIFSGFFCIGQS